MGTLLWLSAIYTKGNNFSDFMFDSLGNRIFKRDQLIKERICFFRSKFFPLRVDSYSKERIAPIGVNFFLLVVATIEKERQKVK